MSWPADPADDDRTRPLEPPPLPAAPPPGALPPGPPPPGPPPPPIVWTPQPPGPPVPTWMPPPPGNGAATASLVLGILAVSLGLLLGWLVFPLPLVFLLAIVGVVLGHVGWGTAKRLDGVGNAAATWGLVLSYVTLGVLVLPLALITVGVLGAVLGV